MSSSMDMFLNALQVIAGMYLIYWAIRMKKTKQLKNDGLISNSVNIDNAPDKESYIRSTFIPDIIVGAVLILSGLAETIVSKFGIKLSTAGLSIIILAVLAVCIVFGFYIVKMQKKYLEP